LPRIVRHPDLLVWWNDDGPVVRNLESGVTLSGDRLAVEVLASFDRAREPSARAHTPVRTAMDVEVDRPTGRARRSQRP